MDELYKIFDGLKYIPPSWDESFMRMVYEVSYKSKDPRTKIGAVLVKDNGIVTTGYNGFPRKVKDLTERYTDKNIKYKFVCHAEANAVHWAAKTGRSSDGTTLYTQGIPCSECCKTIIQGGIIKIVIHEQWPEMLMNKNWMESNNISKIMLEEAEIPVIKFSKVLNMVGYVDGKTINV